MDKDARCPGLDAQNSCKDPATPTTRLKPSQVRGDIKELLYLLSIENEI
jgi:hypothetical protein